MLNLRDVGASGRIRGSTSDGRFPYNTPDDTNDAALSTLVLGPESLPCHDRSARETAHQAPVLRHIYDEEYGEYANVTSSAQILIVKRRRH